MPRFSTEDSGETAVVIPAPECSRVSSASAAHAPILEGSAVAGGGRPLTRATNGPGSPFAARVNLAAKQSRSLLTIQTKRRQADSLLDFTRAGCLTFRAQTNPFLPAPARLLAVRLFPHSSKT